MHPPSSKVLALLVEPRQVKPASSFGFRCAAFSLPSPFSLHRLSGEEAISLDYRRPRSHDALAFLLAFLGMLVILIIVIKL
jgi:hypothetical protein